MAGAAGSAPTPYIPNTDADRERMLARLGLESVEALFGELPERLRDPEMELPPALAEADLVELLRRHAGANAGGDRPSFLGAGAYRRFVPAITAHLTARSEFATSYTPYQPEISQGTLQAAFEYQSVVCELTGMNVSNTGLYDVGSATAEACLMAARVTGRRAAALLEPLHPHTAEVVRTYAYGAGLRVDAVAAVADVTREHACLVAQQPDFLGTIRDLEPVAAAAHDVDALSVVVADPLALGLLRAPGDAGADIMTGEGRDLAGPLALGGPSLGIFAARDSYLRQLPGRVVGQTRELRGPRRHDGSEGAPRTGYVLTLQARDQFIRRERATSNFSTGQSLVALAFAVTLQALGPHGLRQAAELCYQKAHETAARVAGLPGFEVFERGPVVPGVPHAGPVAAGGARRAARRARHHRRPRRVSAPRGRGGRRHASLRDRGDAARAYRRADRGVASDRRRHVTMGQYEDFGAGLAFDRGAPGRRAVDVAAWHGRVTALPPPQLLRESLRLPEMSQGGLGALLHLALRAELRCRLRCLSARLLHHEIQPESRRPRRQPAGLRRDAPAGAAGAVAGFAAGTVRVAADAGPRSPGFPPSASRRRPVLRASSRAC